MQEATQRWRRSKPRVRLVATVCAYSFANDLLADASKFSSDVKSRLPGSDKEAKKEFELSAQKAGQKFDNAVR